MKVIVIAILLMANFPLYKKLFYFIFDSVEGFKESVKYSFTPDLFSLFRGRFWKDQGGEAKLSIFIFLCILLIVVEYFIAVSIIEKIF